MFKDNTRPQMLLPIPMTAAKGEDSNQNSPFDTDEDESSEEKGSAGVDDQPTAAVDNQVKTEVVDSETQVDSTALKESET